MKILVISSGNIVQLAKYTRYFARMGHACVFLNPGWQNTLCRRTFNDEFGGLNVKFYNWRDFDVKKYWKKEKFDCIFGTQQGATLQVLRYQKLLKIPALLQILDIAEASNIANTPEGIKLTHVQKLFIKAYKEINYLTGINLAISEQIKQLIGRDDCSCVFYPVDTELYDSVEEQKTEDFIFMISRLTPSKRVDLAIKACNYANKKLVIASDGSLREDLQQFAKDIKADVEFLGYISDKQKAELMKKCKLHIFTQMWEEASAIPPVEALYCKKPSIVFDYTVQRVIAGNYSYYVEPGNWKEMGEKIAWAYNNYDEATTFSVKGHKWVKNNLAPDIVAAQILDILMRIVNISKI